MRSLVLLLVAGLCAALLVVPAVDAVAQGDTAPVIAPEVETNQRLKVNDWAVITGEAPAAGTIESATFFAIDGQGQRTAQPILTLNQDPNDPQREFLLIEGSSFRGRVQARTPRFTQQAGTVAAVLQVVIDGQTFESNQLLVDHEQPFIVRYDIVAPTTIVVVFSEPVRLTPESTSPFPPDDSPADWEVNGPDRNVLAVDERENDCPDGASGCTRVLTVQAIPEDATPEVFYFPAPTRANYRDLAGRAILRGDGTGARQPAKDRVIPATPQIDLIEGQDPSDGPVAAQSPTPALQLSNLNPDADEQVIIIQVDDQDVGQPIPITATTQTVNVPNLGSDRRNIRIEVEARDRHGNRSDDLNAGSPPRPNGVPDEALYTLDRIPPRPTLATQLDATRVRVLFSETIFPNGPAGEFSIGELVASQVQGEGAVRTLTFPSQIPADTRLHWEPTGTTYVDQVDLELVWTDQVLVNVPPPPTPRITIPASPIVSQTNQVAVRGTIANSSGSALVIDLYDDEALTDPALATDVAVAGNGNWDAGTVTLPNAEGEYRIYAVARDTSTQIVGDAAISQPITVDLNDPVVDITAPTSGGLLGNEPFVVARGGPFEVSWDVEEDLTPNRFELRLTDSAGTETLCGARSWNEEDLSYTTDCNVPDDVADGAGTVTVTALDRSGRSGSDVFDDLDIDVNILGADSELLPNDAGNAVITIDYGAALSGNTSGTDWQANDGRQQPPPSRTPVRATVVEETAVELSFIQSFQAGHPNARPRWELDQFLGNLEGPEEASLQPTGRVRDVVPPALGLGPVPSEPFNGQTTRNALPGCIDDDEATTCPTGPTVMVTGLTDTGLDYDTEKAALDTNDVFLFSGARTAEDIAEATDIRRVKAGDNGSFSLLVPLTTNAEQTFTVLVQDFHGSVGQEPVLQTFTVIEDSLAPVFQPFTARLTGQVEDQPQVRVDYALNEEVVSAIVETRVGDGDWTVREEGELTAGSFTFDVTSADILAGIQARGRATDLAGNSGTQLIQLGTAVEIIDALATSPRTIELTTSEPVVAPPDPGSFVVLAGPGVAEVDVAGDLITLTLNDDLTTTTPRVRYIDRGDIATPDGRNLLSAEITARRGFVFGVTGLAVGPTLESTGANLSWVDDRNRPEHIVTYEVSRSDEIVAELAPLDRSFTDDPAPAGAQTYSVVVVDDAGRRSPPADVPFTVGPGPDADGTDGGTGFPPGSEIITDCQFPAEPNILPSGGTALDCNGEVALIVPAGAVDEPHFARIVERSNVAMGGFAPFMNSYQMVAVAADDLTTLDAFAQYAEVSFRPGTAVLDAQVRERVTALRPRSDGLIDEISTRAARGEATTQILTLGTFAPTEADGATVRVFGPDPAIAADRFATAAGLSQTVFRTAGAAVLARADDYPDALAASALAAQIGGPVLLSRTTDVPITTMLELRRLGVDEVILVGGTAALSADVNEQLVAAGFDLDRVAGATRFHTSAAVAERVGSFLGEAFLAVGNNFADALAASGPSAALTRPILLTQTETLTQVTADALFDLGITDITIVGGEAVVSPEVEAGLVAGGYDVTRAAGPNRYATAVTLAGQLVEQGVQDNRRPVVASGQGDGRTSPDALASGPIASRHGSPLLLIPKDVSIVDVDTYLATNATDIRGIVMAGGPAAVSPEVRTIVDQRAD